MDLKSIIAAILASIPAISTIIELFDKWFSKSPEEKERGRIADQVKERKKAIGKVNEAFKDARKGDTTKLNKLINS